MQAIFWLPKYLEKNQDNLYKQMGNQMDDLKNNNCDDERVSDSTATTTTITEEAVTTEELKKSI